MPLLASRTSSNAASSSVIRAKRKNKEGSFCYYQTGAGMPRWGLRKEIASAALFSVREKTAPCFEHTYPGNSWNTHIINSMIQMLGHEQ